VLIERTSLWGATLICLIFAGFLIRIRPDQSVLSPRYLTTQIHVYNEVPRQALMDALKKTDTGATGAQRPDCRQRRASQPGYGTVAVEIHAAVARKAVHRLRILNATARSAAARSRHCSAAATTTVAATLPSRPLCCTQRPLERVAIKHGPDFDQPMQRSRRPRLAQRLGPLWATGSLTNLAI
jgi:hypothetical protein